MTEEHKNKIRQAHLGTKQPESYKQKMILWRKENGGGFQGRKHTQETKYNWSLKRKGIKPSQKTIDKLRLRKWTPEQREKIVFKITGENNPIWIKDRTKLKDDHKERGGQLHREWSRQVKNRDGWKCRISNNDCSGSVVAHHILSWRDHQSLRYDLNNGITLCKAHHPLKRVEENKLSPFFQKMVSENN